MCCVATIRLGLAKASAAGPDPSRASQVSGALMSSGSALKSGAFMSGGLASAGTSRPWRLDQSTVFLAEAAVIYALITNS